MKTPTLDTSTLCATYGRYSTYNQDARSLEDQERRCRDYAVKNQLTVTHVFGDAAQSGGSTDRDDLQRLLAEAKRGKKSPFGVVLVDDLSRLSRDLGDTWDLVFVRMAAARIVLVDVTTGTRSDSPQARVMFGALALVNDIFRQLARTETHRGLEGRAIAGFSTGGKTFGYRSVVEENATDPEHARRRLVVFEPEAEIVRRIFTLFANGKALVDIARLLNDEKIPSPKEHTGKHRGWASTTIRSMLGNERYIGISTWNRTKCELIPGSRTHRATARPESEWRITQLPALVIIEPALWAAVQARLQLAVRRGPGRPPGTGLHKYLLSGLLRCGSCGSPMQVTSGFPTASGRRYGSFACGAGRTKGAAICGNKLTVADSKLSRAVLGALSGLLTSPAAVDHFVMKFGEHLSRNHKAVGSKGRTQLDRRIDEARTCARNLGEAIGKYGMSETLGEQLRDAEALLKRLREERAKTVTVSDRSQTPPSRERVVSYLADLTNTLKADSSRGNGLLAKHVGHITMTPVHEDKRRFYRATGAFSLSEDQVSIDLPGTLDNRGCASAQCS